MFLGVVVVLGTEVLSDEKSTHDFPRVFKTTGSDCICDIFSSCIKALGIKNASQAEN